MGYARIIGHATDVWDTVWDVRERRATKHDWLIEIGWPHGEPRGVGCRGVALILTPALAEYLTATRPRDVVLPICDSSIKRLRAKLGLRWDWDAWWAARAEDLSVMTLERFAERHSCSVGIASQRRAALRETRER